MRDVDFVAADRGPDADVHGLLIVELRDHVRLFGAQLHARDVRQTDDRAAAIGHDEILELIGGTQIGVGQQVDLNEIALGLAHGGDVVVAPQGPEDITGREVVRRQPIGIDPDTHGDRTAANDIGPLHAGDRRQLRLERARQPIGDCRNVPLLGRKAQIERRVGTVGALHLDLWRLGLRRKLRPHLLQPCCHLGQRRGAVLIQLQSHRHGADAGTTRRFDVIDTADGRDGALDRRREKTAHGFGARAVIDRRDDDRRALDVRVLLHGERGQRPPSHEHDGEIDDHREYRVPDEQIGEGAHQ